VGRPFFSARIDDLEALARDRSTSPDQLAKLRSELEHRHTLRALKLKKDLDRLLAKPQPLADSVSKASPAALATQGGDIKLAKLNLSTRAKNILASHKITHASELSKLSGAQLLSTPNVGIKTFNELRRVLHSLGLDFGKTVAGSPSAAVVQAVLPLSYRIDEPRDLKGALKAHVDAAVKSERNSQWTIAHLGWDGKPGRTLESIGTQFGVTRERVRQVAAKCCAVLKERETIPRAVGDVLQLIDAHAPITQSHLDALIQSSGLNAEPFHVSGIQRAAEVFGLDFPYSIREGAEVLIIPNKLVGFPSRILRSAKLEISAHGCIVNDQLLELWRSIAGAPIDLQFAQAVLESEGSFGRVSGCEEWWWRPTLATRGRNRLVNTIMKIVAAAGRIRIKELRDAARRHVRTKHIAPPSLVLRAICASLPPLRVVDDWVEQIPEFPWDQVLNETEDLLLEIFRRRGPILDSYTVSQEGAALGLNENSLGIYKTYSPLLWRPIAGHYAVVGATLPPGLVDELDRSRHHKRGESLLESGWTGDRRILLAYRITKGVWLSGLLSVPSSVAAMLQGDYDLFAFGTHALAPINVREATAFGMRPFLRMFGAELGDVVVVTFDPRTRRCECWLGGDEVADIAAGGPDAILMHFAGGDAVENTA
jgi:hypothetical protein